MKTRPSQQNKDCLRGTQKCFPDDFLRGLPSFVIVIVMLPSHLSKHTKAATADGLTSKLTKKCEKF
jgi:hypothetical protein